MKTHLLPPELRCLPTVIARKYVQYGVGGVEGIEFDRDRNIITGLKPAGGTTTQVLKIDQEKNISLLYEQDHGHIVGVAIHKDGRIFTCDIKGGLPVISADGKFIRDLRQQPNVPEIIPNDCCFDSKGDFYVTDFHEFPLWNHIGGLYKFTQESDYTECICLLDGMQTPNGIGLSPDEKYLWSAETIPNSLVRCLLGPDRTILPPFFAVKRCYHCNGTDMCDSLKVDDAGNVYVAMQFGGRVLVFDDDGIPIMNVVIEDRYDNHCMKTPNLAIHPDKCKGYITASGDDGAWLYEFDTLAPAAHMYAFK